jgi:hypothetical protein
MQNELLSILLAMRDFLDPLRRNFSGRDELEHMFYSYGWDVSLDLDIFEEIKQRTDIGSLVDDFMHEADVVTDELDADGSTAPSLEQLRRLAVRSQAAIRAAAGLELSSLAQLPEPIAQAEFWQDIASHVLDDLVERFARLRFPKGYFVLHAFGVFQYVQTDPQAAHRHKYLRTTIDWDRAVSLLTSPVDSFKQLYSWGDDTIAFKHDRLVAALENVLNANHLVSRRAPPSPLVAPLPPGNFALDLDQEALWVEILHVVPLRGSSVYELGLELLAAKRTGEDRVTGFAIRPVVRGGEELDLKVAPDLHLKAKAGLAGMQPAIVALMPGGAEWMSGRVDGGVSVELVRQGESPLRLLGSENGSRVEVARASAGLSITGAASSPELVFNIKLGGAGGDPKDGGKIVLSLGGADDFVKSRVKSEGIEIPFSLEVAWSSKSGLRFNGAAGLDFVIPFRLPLSIVELRDVHVALRERKHPPAPSSLQLSVSPGIRGHLGPVEFLVEGLGFALEATRYSEGELLMLPPDKEPLFGTLDLELGFTPPSAIGLSIDAGGFSGGGFIRADRDGGEYVGTLELQYRDKIHVKAVGVLATKIPGGPSYALTIVISAEFTPIQLGFGISLDGVGGLIGINRVVARDQLRPALRDGSLDSILFPKNLIENAPQIISDLKRHFPPTDGHYLIGPMAKLSWGRRSLATLELGLILELPGFGIFILGVLRVIAPTDEEALLKLQVNFLGEIDFDKKQFSLDATLYESSFMTFVLTGDMAVRIYWGADNANVLATAGGFHPAYTPPAMALPQLDRMAIAFFQGNPRLTAQAYFAITANTFQIGAKLELYYGVKIFSVSGFLSIDALLQPVPFHFIAEVAGSLAVKSGNTTLFAIRLELTLEGPGPLRARGKGSFEIGFIVTVTVSASFDVTFGELIRQILRLVSVAPLIEEALRDASNWLPLVEGPLRRHVAMREVPPSAGVLMPPMGRLAVLQRVAPLNIPIQRLGPARVEGGSTFSIVNITLGGDQEEGLPITEQFAAAQFIDMSDDEKLSRKSFEPFAAGIQLGGAASCDTDFQRHADVTYEVVYIRKPRRRLFMSIQDKLMGLFVGMSAAAKSRSSTTPNSPTGLGTPKVALSTETFVVAGVADLAPHAPGLVFSSETAAVLAMHRIVANDTRLADKLQVVSSYEVAA